MNKQECLSMANKAKHAAKVASERAAMYASAFGGNDQLTQRALLDADVATEASVMWERIAELHHKTRQAALIKGLIPSWVFGYKNN